MKRRTRSLLGCALLLAAAVALVVGYVAFGPKTHKVLAQDIPPTGAFGFLVNTWGTAPVTPAGAVGVINFDGAGGVTGSYTAYFTSETLDFPDAVNTLAFGNNDSGQVVGQYTDATGDSHAFLYSPGDPVPFTQLDFPDGTATRAFGINNSAIIVGAYNVMSDRHGFQYREGNFSTVDFPSAAFTIAHRIDDSGDIVGVYGEDQAGNISHGFLMSGADFTQIDFPDAPSFTEVNGVNNSGDIVGDYMLDGVVHGFLNSGGTFSTIDFPEASSTVALAINNSGTIVGWYATMGIIHGFVYSGGNFSTIDFPDASSTFAFGINNLGSIVGYYTDQSGNRHGFLASPSQPVPSSWPRGGKPHDEQRVLVGRCADSPASSFSLPDSFGAEGTPNPLSPACVIFRITPSMVSLTCPRAAPQTRRRFSVWPPD